MPVDSPQGEDGRRGDGRAGAAVSADLALIVEHFTRFAVEQPSAVRSYRRHDEIITQGAVGDTIFLILDGQADIVVASLDKEVTVASRSKGQIVGESGLLNRNKPRNATVRVISETLTAAALTREDVLALAAAHADFRQGFAALWSLERERALETRSITRSKYSVRSEFIAVMIGDLHDFTRLSSRIYEEAMENLLYEFVETSAVVCAQHGGSFEDQGDGFKSVFRSADPAASAIGCTGDLIRNFVQLRANWSDQQAEIGQLGLGLGIVTDFMSIRLRQDLPDAHERVISNSINFAHHMAKAKGDPSGIDLVLDETTHRGLPPPVQHLFRRTSIRIEAGRTDIAVYRNARQGTSLPGALEAVHAAPMPEPERVPAAIYDHHAEAVDAAATVFICYNARDREEARRVNVFLKKAGVATWFDEERLKPGDVWLEAVERDLPSCKTCLVLIGPNGSGPWQGGEINYFTEQLQQGRCRVIPVILKAATGEPAIPVFLRAIQRIDLRVDEAMGLLNIVQAIRQ